MPLALVTRHTEGATGHDGHQGAGIRTVTVGDPRRRDSSGPFLSAPGALPRSRLRPRSGPRDLRRDRPAVDRSGRLLQAAPDFVLRGAAVRTATAAGRRRPAQSALVSGV